MSLWQYTWQTLHETSDLWWQKIWDCLTPDVKKIFWKLYQTMNSPPAAYGVQLRLKHSLVLLHDISQRNSHMLPVFTLCAVQTHGCLAWLAVELHHLQRETNWVKIPSLTGLWVSEVIFSVSFTWIVKKRNKHRATLVRWCQSWCVTKSFPPSPHGSGSRGASLQPQHWLTPGHCRPPAASTLSLVAVPGNKWRYLKRDYAVQWTRFNNQVKVESIYVYIVYGMCPVWICEHLFLIVFMTQTHILLPFENPTFNIFIL